MFSTRNKFNFILFLVNIFFLLYYSAQLLIYTDEFAIENIGFFNHAVAGLSEIIGIIFLSLAVGLAIVAIKDLKNQYPLLITILLMQSIIALNFWRYVITDAPGEANIDIIIYNASIFSIMSLVIFIIILRSK